MKRLRLVKVDVLAHFVVDDGESLTEIGSGPVTVTAADWPGYAERFEADRLAQEQAMNAEAGQ